MTKLAVLISQEEGYEIPGSVPNRDNNPGDLRHSPHSFHSPSDPNGIGQIPTKAEGWEDLEDQLQKYAARRLTLQQMVYEFAPPIENNSAAYLNYLCQGLGCQPDISVTDALQIT